MKALQELLAVVGIILVTSGMGFSQVNLTEASENAGNMTEEAGNGLIQDISNFVTSTSPAFLIILGIILVVGSGFAKIIGYILIVFAVIRLLLNLI